MVRKKARWLAAAAILVVLTFPGRLAAAQATPQYVAIDMGTLGGPNAYFNLPGQTMNASGAVVFSGETSTPDPLAPYCTDPECLGQLGVLWQRGARAVLHSLPGASFAAPFALNDTGLAVGISELTTIDPEIDLLEARAVLWRNGQAVNLGTLPGGSESNAFAVNDQGLIAGPSNNGVPDPYGCQIFVCWPNQTRGFVWQHGVMKDMGTLGGPDALPLFMNNAGQVAGNSYTNATPNPDNGCVPGPAPTQDPFLWQNGKMIDLGTLGGTCGGANGMNSSGEVVGQSNLAGNQTFHPFLWNGSRMIDIGTLGGSFGSANSVNDAGHVAGWATVPGDATAHAVLWKSGALTDLGAVRGQPCSYADSVNVRDEVVGGSCTSGANGWLWQHGSLYDLNSLVAPSDLHLTEAVSINDQGEIVGFAMLLNGNQHVVLLVPSDLAHARGLTSNVPVTSAEEATVRSSTPARIELEPLLHPSRQRRYHHQPG